jgi:hypothetical protein
VQGYVRFFSPSAIVIASPTKPVRLGERRARRFSRELNVLRDTTLFSSQPFRILDWFDRRHIIIILLSVFIRNGFDRTPSRANKRRLFPLQDYRTVVAACVVAVIYYSITNYYYYYFQFFRHPQIRYNDKL